MAHVHQAKGAPASAEPASSQYSELAVVAILEERIKRGIYAPGSRLPAERTLAAEIGVSRRFIRMACARLIEQGLLEKSHYRRPFVAFSAGGHRLPHVQTLRKEPSASASTTIAAILPSHPSFPGGLSTVAGIHKVLADMGSPFRLAFLDTFHRDRTEVLRREAQAIQSALEEGVAGIIWWYYSDEDVVLDVVRRNPEIAIVFIDRHPQNIHCDFAGIDDVESSRAAVEHLIDLGHTRIAHLMDPGSYSTILERAQGYRTALSARGIPVADELMVHLDWHEQRMQRAFDRLFKLAEPPTALFTSNDFIAYEFMKIAEERGVHVPGDLSVVGHGNIDRYAPREMLTSVDQPFETIGKAAAKLLLKRLEQPSEFRSTFQQVILQAPLVIRSSTRKLQAD